MVRYTAPMTQRISSLLLIAAFVFSHPGCGKEDAQEGSSGPVVVLATSMGDIAIELNPQKAPKTVENFLAYVDEGFYDGTIFHRVMPDFMIQGGGMLANMTPKETHPPVTNEADNGLTNDRGTVAMARTAAVNSATSQFFINVTDNSYLNHGVRDFGYAVFGRVIDGMDVADAIAVAPTRPPNIPVEPILIVSARRR